MNANDLFKAVFELDLDPIKVKLMHVESGEGWSKEKVNLVEKEYRRFLCLMKIYPNEATAPLEDVDTFWHYHILDTLKYADDCDQVFGRFLHHYPYVGLRGTDDEQFRIDSGERMRTLYENTFGEAYPSSAACLNGSGERMAFCGGPDSKNFGGRTDIIGASPSFCGGPDSKNFGGRTDAAGVRLAFCGGPDSKNFGGPTDTLGARLSFCGGPDSAKPGHADILGANLAFCGGPDSKKLNNRNPIIFAKIAFCGGPDIQKTDSRTAIATPQATQAA